MERAPSWTTKDQNAAMREGWAIFNMDESNMRLERDDEAGIFKGDGDAWLHVKNKARDGSQFHRRALAVLRVKAPKEYAGIMSYKGGR